MRRLTPAEYFSTVKDLLSVVVKAPEAPARLADDSFDNDITNLTVSSSVVEQYLADAEIYAKAATPSATKLLPCDATAPDEACVRKFISALGQRAYRRTLEAADVNSLYGTYLLGKNLGGVSAGIEYTLTHILQAPGFVYRLELGESASLGQPRRLTSFEMASRLSYFLWGTMPDQTLLTVASAGQLTNRDQVAVQVRRMMRDAAGQPVPATRNVMTSFHVQWLGLREIDTLTKDAKLYPGFPALRKAIRQETEQFIDDRVWGGGTIEELLNVRSSFVNEPLAALYKIPGVTGPELRKVNLDPTERAGILTQASLLALTGGSNAVSPIRRGLFVREKILCTDVPPPPPNVVQNVPAASAVLKTDRERYAAHASDPVCAACHRLMDQVGFAFGVYDGIGAYQGQTAKGVPIDGHGDLIATDVDGPFDNAVDLMDRIARSASAQSCVVRHWFRYMNGRPEVPEDACAVQTVVKQVAKSGGRIEDLVMALTQSDAFQFLPAKTP